MDWLAAAADTHPEVPAVITAERTVSYAELDCAANGVASFVAAGDRSNAVAFWGDRSLETVAAVWGIPRAGMTAVAVDPRTPPADAMEAARAAGVHGLWVTPDGGFDQLLDRGAAGFEAKPRPEAAYIVFTSGSGGRPKGVLLTDDNVAAAVAGSRDRLGNGPADTWLCVLPLFHVGGLSILWRQAESGAPVVLVDRFDPVAEALDGVTFASLVPVSLRRLVATERRGIYELPAADFGREAFDAVLTFRNLHNLTPAARATANRAIFEALRPGGVYGVVDHTRRHMQPDGPENRRRLDPVRVIHEIEGAGFEFEAFSELHYRLDDELRYEVGRQSVTGNTDRFTLRFRKPR